MPFKKLSRVLKRPDEHYYLLKKESYIKEEKTKFVKDEVGNTVKKTKYIYKDSNGKIIDKDAIGNQPEEYEIIEELQGLIQHDQTESINNAGEDADIYYKGYFVPTFTINIGCLSDYRIKLENDYETLFLKIIEYDPNNFLRNKKHHITLALKKDVRYYGREQSIKEDKRNK